MQRAAVLERVRSVVADLPETLAAVCAAGRAAGLDHPVVARLEAEGTRRAAACLAALERAGDGAEGGG